jgi:proton-dependent oligopeptide transporter, POT family
MTAPMASELTPEVPRTTPPARMPRQIPFILGNEACERFSFYGMRNILTTFLKASLLLYLPTKEQRELVASDVFHTFVMGVYFFPLLGGWLADRYFGKYHTILWFSLIYCAGHGCLALFPYDPTGFYAGLGLIAFGSGGIKPLVVSFMGDQFDSRNKHLAKLAFDAFYWMINIGSLFATLTMSRLLKAYGPELAFGVPGILMLIATIVFFIARKHYVLVPPAPSHPDSFLRVMRTALVTRATGRGRPGLVVAVVGCVLAAGSAALWPAALLAPASALCLALVVLLAFTGVGTVMQLERARGAHPDEAVDGVRAVLRVLILFALVTPFWSLFDQKASTWVFQGQNMVKPSWWFLDATEMQLLNPLLVLTLIPINNFVVFPWLRRRGWQPTALRRMTSGIALAGVSWIVAGILQLSIDSGAGVSLVWQVAPYVLLTAGEVLVSATGLEFAYSQAPPSMKGVLMSCWYLAVTIGQLWVLLANASVKSASVTGWIAGTTGLGTTAFLMFFFAVFAFVAALVFGLYARRYREVDHYRV